MVLPNGNVSLSITTDQVRKGFHMDQATDWVLILTFQNGLLWYSIDLKRLPWLIAFKVNFKRILSRNDFIRVNLSLTIADIQMAQRRTKRGRELNILLT